MARRIRILVPAVAALAAAALWWWLGQTPPARSPEATGVSDVAPATATAVLEAPQSNVPIVPAAPGVAAAERDPAAPSPVDARKLAATPTPTRGAIEAMLDAPIDRNHAIDLFAEHLAKLEQNGSDGPLDTGSAQRLQEFAARADGGDDSQRIAHALQKQLEDWLSQFPTERANHLALISVVCKVGACQVLLAESSIDVTSAAARKAMDLAPALTVLTQTRWWQQLGLVLTSTDLTLADAAAPEDVPRYALWTLYLSVAG
ncbi:MAG: hypothetical protein ABI843_08540 [Dokdonella sp.]